MRLSLPKSQPWTCWSLSAQRTRPEVSGKDTCRGPDRLQAGCMAAPIAFSSRMSRLSRAIRQRDILAAGDGAANSVICATKAGRTQTG